MEDTVKINKCYLWTEKLKVDCADIELVWTDKTIKKMQELLQNKFRSVDQDHEIAPEAFRNTESGNPSDTTVQLIESLHARFPCNQPTMYLLKMYNTGKWSFVSWLYPHHNFLCVFGFRADTDPSESVWDQETMYISPRVRRYMRKRLDLGQVDPGHDRLITFVKMPVVKEQDEFSSDEDLEDLMSDYLQKLEAFTEDQSGH